MPRRPTVELSTAGYLERHSVGATMGATVVAGLFLSILPLPDALQPFPALRSTPSTALRAMLWPARTSELPQPEATDEVEPADRAMVFEEMDLTGGGTDVNASAQEARRWEKLIRSVEAAHQAIDDPCVAANCSQTALTPFFTALRALSGGSSAEPVRVVTIGTSLIASDHITDVTRRLLQSRHGSGGLGFMFVDRPTRNAGRTVRSGSATPGWVIEKVTDTRPLRVAGIGGAAFTAPGGQPQETTFIAAGTRRADLFLLSQPGGGVLRVFADGTVLDEFSTEGPADAPLFQTVKVPANALLLTFKTAGGPVRLDGVVLENGQRGVVFDSLGLPGATAQVLLREDVGLFQAQLEQRKPNLVVLMIGGNDAFDLSLRRYSAARAEDSMQELITRVKGAVPQAACLLAAPPDAGIWRMDKTINPRVETKLVNAYMKKLAAANGCAYYDMQAAMGGEGAITRWWNAGLMNRDLVHPLATGGDVMGYMLDTALERARAKHDAARANPRGGRTPAPVRRPRGEVGACAVGPRARLTRGRADGGRVRHSSDAGLSRGGGVVGGADAGPAPDLDAGPFEPTAAAPAEVAIAGSPDAGLCCVADGGLPPAGFLTQPDALVHVFEKLRQLEVHGLGRVGIAQLGASHTAAQYFTDELRRLLGARFGYAGRGFVAAGKPSNRLEAAGVARSLNGKWRVTDAMGVKTSGVTWGLTGIRAEGSAGASMAVSFDEPGGVPEDTARVQVYYAEGPDGGTPEIRVDGKAVPVPAAAEPGQSEVRVLELAVPGFRHEVEITNPGPGPLTVFGVSHELMRPGVVYDAFGLPGSTAQTLASYAQRPLAQQLEARQVDLFVLFYGTNESSMALPQIEEMKRSYPVVMSTLKLSSPDAACLILGPTDRMSKKGPKRTWRETESINEVQVAMREVAAANGCAFWSTRDVMGGKGSIETWRKSKLANKDHVHLTSEGYQKLAGMLIGDLMRVYGAWIPPATGEGDAP